MSEVKSAREQKPNVEMTGNRVSLPCVLWLTALLILLGWGITERVLHKRAETKRLHSALHAGGDWLVRIVPHSLQIEKQDASKNCKISVDVQYQVPLDVRKAIVKLNEVSPRGLETISSVEVSPGNGVLSMRAEVLNYNEKHDHFFVELVQDAQMQSSLCALPHP